LHTSAAHCASVPLTLKERQDRRAERALRAEEKRPHYVLGTRRGDDAKWLNCDLAKILVTEEELATNAEPQPFTLSTGVLWMPRLLNYGVGEAEKELLFQLLPPLTAEMGGIRRPTAWTMTMHHEAEKTEMMKANMLARVIDLRNANARGIAYENRRRIVAAFSDPGKPSDTGRPEVQAALMTMRIRNLWDHLQQHKTDRGTRPRLAKIVHHRAKILKYLKAVSRQRYDDVLPRLGIEPESVEGELII